MDSNSNTSSLDRNTVSIFPHIVCNLKGQGLCPRKECKRNCNQEGFNSVSFVPMPQSWFECEYFVGE